MKKNAPGTSETKQCVLNWQGTGPWHCNKKLKEKYLLCDHISRLSVHLPSLHQEHKVDQGWGALGQSPALLKTESYPYPDLQLGK